MPQQGDVTLRQTTDDGEISVTGGIVEMSGGLGSAAYLSLFGGNEEDDGSANSAANWWANLIESDPVKTYRSETQNLLQAIPAIPANLRRVEDAALRDLDWFLTSSVASRVLVAVTIPALNRVGIEVTIEARGEESTFEFVENWGAGL